jgi:hypothetical protein
VWSFACRCPSSAQPRALGRKVSDEFSVPVSLQKDLRENDRGPLESNMAIIDHSPTLGDFSDTAALIAEFDLLIPVDTAVAH